MKIKFNGKELMSEVRQSEIVQLAKPEIKAVGYSSLVCGVAAPVLALTSAKVMLPIMTVGYASVLIGSAMSTMTKSAKYMIANR